MKTTYKVSDRNLLAPNGKLAALFIDIDGTILECEPYFHEAKSRFVHLMTLIGFSTNDAESVLHKHDHYRMQAGSFHYDIFGDAMIDAYTELCQSHNRTVDDMIMGICRDLGRGPFYRQPVLFKDAGPVLNRSRHNFLIFAVSLGTREVQKYKIRQAGLDSVFDEIIIIPRVEKLKVVQEIIDDLNIDPTASAFIGNSLKADGACLAVTNFVYLPLEGGTPFDQAPLPRDSPYQTFNVRDWLDAEQSALQRLLRRRKLIKAA